MQTHTEIGGKTLQGREWREWYIGQRTTCQARLCEIVRFGKRQPGRVLIRWACTGRTAWVGMYEITPEISIGG